MDTYTYSYKTDSKNEIIGRVQAIDLFEAQIKVAMIKQLSIKDTEQLFEIKKTNSNEKNVRSY
jgi:flagellar biosynthesis protein FliP|tara:strand:- start:321 stop:509 length:189 start_codon:yes stop_codon:yes gene_type:complete